MGVQERRAPPGQPIHIRCVDGPAVSAHVADPVAHVVYRDKQDIGRSVGRPDGRPTAAPSEKKEEPVIDEEEQKVKVAEKASTVMDFFTGLHETMFEKPVFHAFGKKVSPFTILGVSFVSVVVILSIFKIKRKYAKKAGEKEQLVTDVHYMSKKEIKKSDDIKVKK